MNAERSTVTLNDIPDGVVVADAAGRVQCANDAFLAMIGREREEVTGCLLEELVADEDVLRMLGFESIFLEERVQDASVIFLDASGKTRRLLVCSNPSSDRSRITLTARTYATLHKELADVSKWAASEQERADAIARTRDELAQKNQALREAQEEIQTAYARLQDEVATRERLEGELRLAQRLEAVGQLAAGVAHEINTPMQYIGDNIRFLTKGLGATLGYVEQMQQLFLGLECVPEQTKQELNKLRRRVRLDFLAEQMPRALRDSEQGVEHVSSIVRAMKSFTHMDHGEKAFGDINQAILDTLAVSQNEYKSVAKVETDLGELPALRCFIGKLNQVFLNLVVNAAHAIADRKLDGLGTIKVSSRCVEETVELRFTDNGCGIPEEVRGKIYDQFFTTKAVGRGTGQGLALARSIVVEGHNGALDFETEVGVGTTFIVRLPVAEEG